MEKRNGVRQLRPTEKFADRRAPRHFAPDARLVPIAGSMELDIELEAEQVMGCVHWRLRQLSTEATSISFDAVDFDQLEVKSSTAGVPSWHYDGRRVSVNWPVGTDLDGAEVILHWRVRKPNAGVYFIGPPNARLCKPIVGMFTDNETERARYWLPCVDHPSVRTTVELVIRSSEACVHLGPGLPRGYTGGEHAITSKWVLDSPCPSYLLCFALGDFAHYKMNALDGRSLDVFGFVPMKEVDLARYFAPTTGMMSWMEARLGVPFPYPKYWQFVGPGVGGAMENISLTSWDAAFFGDENDHAELGWLVDIVNLHEMAHSYFGDLVVIRDYSHAWLKEGWASYLEAVWLEETVGVEDAQWFMYEDRLSYLDEVQGRYERPIITRYFNHSWQMFDRHLYQGAAWRLHMLRRKLGEAAFWSGVKDYLERFSHSVADTDDFRKCLELTSGYDLNRFFEDWFRSPGCPTLAVTGSDQDQGFAVTIAQQLGEGDKQPFEMGIEVGFLDTEGTWHFASGDLGDGQCVLTLNTQEPPVAVIIDPHGQSLFKLNTKLPFRFYERLLEDDAFILGRVQAAEFLFADGSKRAMQLLDNAFKKEDHFGVRRLFARLASNKVNARKLRLLGGWLMAERDPRVLVTIANALKGEHVDDEIKRALAKVLPLTGLGSRARAAFYETMGQIGGAETIERLESVLVDYTEPEVVRTGALNGLSRIPEVDSWEVISSHYESLGKDIYLARARHVALVRPSLSLSPDYRERVLATLSEISMRVGGAEATQVAEALVLLGDSRGTDLLRRLMEGCDHQTRAHLMRVASRLEAKLSADSGAATLAELSSRVRAIELTNAEASEPSQSN